VAARSPVLLPILFAAVVMGSMFSLLLASDYQRALATDRLYEELAAKRVEVTMWRLKNPEPACFDMDDGTLQKFEFLRMLVQEADGNVAMPIVADGNRYDGFGTRFEDGAEAAGLVRSFGFAHAKEVRTVRGLSDDIHTFSCNLQYKGNQYFMQAKFYSLQYLDEYSGWLPIEIIDATSDGRSTAGGAAKDHTVYSPFNNTAVWINRSHSWVTLELAYNMTTPDRNQATETVSARIPPRGAWDRFLNNPLGREDVTYQYKVREYPWMHGRVFLKQYPMCMDPGEAASFYSQTKFPFRFPAYLPAGYTYQCMMAYKASVEMYFWDRQFDLSRRDEQMDQGAIVLKISDENRGYGIPEDNYSRMSDDEKAISTYEYILKANPALRPQLIDINGKKAWANDSTDTGGRQEVRFHNGTVITTGSPIPSRLVFYDDGTGISLQGNIPLDELVKIARSLPPQARRA
jgi:hypothetical protein